jgi:lysyl-tRNA synthetase class 2
MQNQSSDLAGQRQQRINNLNKLRGIGINPYPSISQKDFSNKEIKDNFTKFENKTVILAGRLIAKREHGKLIFGDLQDASDTIQLAIKKDEIEADLKNGFLGWTELKLIDVSDFIQVEGSISKTQQGEVTLFVKKLTLLSKSLRPMPTQIDDKEQQFRRRYIDLAINTKRQELFKRKSKFWEASREFMKENGFMEVETPVLEHVTGGADATPFMTHHNALDQDFYLRISTELYQKRLIGGGFEKIYTLGPNFRNEGLSDEHLQEFYQLEWYWAYADYRNNMELVKNLFRYIAKEVYGKTKFQTRGHSFDLSDDWEEISYPEIIKKKFDIDIFEDSDEKMLNKLKGAGVELGGAINRSRLIDNLWKVIRKEISGPAFLINEPAFMSPLAKAKTGDARLTERFHVIIAGSELGNGYSEINDPQYQLSQFLNQQAMRDKGDDEAQMLDIDYVEMLEYGMPPTSGYGQSERVFWYLEDITGREGTFFPQMRHEVEKLTKEFYKEVKFEGAVINTAQKNDSSDLKGLPSKEEALKLLEEHVKDDYQKLHAKMVAESMKMYANKFSANEDLWYITGLLHDLDYHKFPDEHPKESLKWFSEWGYPQELIQAVSAHAMGSGRTETQPKTQLDFALIACDELSGLLYAYSLMRPTGFEGMEAKSVMKKFKDKAFAAKIDREEIKKGVEGLGIDLKEHIENLIKTFTSKL